MPVQRSAAAAAALCCVVVVVGVRSLVPQPLYSTPAPTPPPAEHAAEVAGLRKRLRDAEHRVAAAERRVRAAQQRQGNGTVASAASSSASVSASRKPALPWDGYSSAHCTGGDTHGIAADKRKPKEESDGWRRSSCRFRYLCFDIEKKEFVYYRKPGDPFGSFHGVALAAPNVAWNKTEQLRNRWMPRIEDRPADRRTPMLTDQTAYVIHAEHCGANVMHLVMDSFLPWYLIVRLFGLEQLKLQPLRVPLLLWGTCDFTALRAKAKPGTKLYAPGAEHRVETCRRTYKRWLPTMVPGQETLPLTTTWEPQGRKRGVVCIPHSAAGVGVLSDHCFRSHGWHWDKEKNTLHHCNQGRGGMLWGFRRHLMSAVGIDHSIAPTRHVVAFLTGGSRASWPRLTVPAAKELKARGVEVWQGTFDGMPARQQMQLLQGATAAVAAMGGNTVSCLFLPRGAGLILLHDSQSRLDWELWTHVSHLSVRWHHNAVSPDTLLRTVFEELRRFQSFASAPFAALPLTLVV
eukprot:TRINITY_DN12186_c2_g1_i1.p1 TRINITY_DN12186_c2_g1~~TRINITY_DN12186_c2_g1_i1.p1  ORF type:complete len:518 (+),score=165.54 TRINITY_DN12186_c2_g1_i1:100-1653(+)